MSLLPGIFKRTGDVFTSGLPSIRARAQVTSWVKELWRNSKNKRRFSIGRLISRQNSISCYCHLLIASSFDTSTLTYTLSNPLVNTSPVLLKIFCSLLSSFSWLHFTYLSLKLVVNGLCAAFTRVTCNLLLWVQLTEGACSWNYKCKSANSLSS